MSNQEILVAKLTKVDAVSGKFWGVAALEQLDKTGETMDYAKSKPYFEQMGKMFSDATGGKSVASIRVMHQKKVAGVATNMFFNDLSKAVEIEGEVIDPVEREIMLKGGYTGLSIGGLKRVIQGENGERRYIAMPSEISLVDNPAMYGAKIMVKYADHDEEIELGENKDSKELTLVKYLISELGLECDLSKISEKNLLQKSEDAVNLIDEVLMKQFTDISVESRLDTKGDETMSDEPKVNEAIEELKKNYETLQNEGAAKLETLQKSFDDKFEAFEKSIDGKLEAVAELSKNVDVITDAVNTVLKKLLELPAPAKGVRTMAKDSDSAYQDVPDDKKQDEPEDENLEKSHDPQKALAAMKKVKPVIVA